MSSPGRAMPTSPRARQTRQRLGMAALGGARTGKSSDHPPSQAPELSGMGRGGAGAALSPPGRAPSGSKLDHPA
eukprot:9339864-Pyramimonas_sp.AAC.1